jgi:hypothetical protein
MLASTHFLMKISGGNIQKENNGIYVICFGHFKSKFCGCLVKAMDFKHFTSLITSVLLVPCGGCNKSPRTFYQ